MEYEHIILYFLNALNEVIRSQNNGELDEKFSVDWEDYKNAVLVTYKEDDGTVSKLDGPVNFNVVPLRESTLKGTSYEDYNAFAQKVKELNEKSTIVSDVLRESMNIVNAMSISLSRSYAKSGELNKKILMVINQNLKLVKKINQQ